MYSPNRSDASCALIHQSNGSTKHGYKAYTHTKHTRIQSIHAYKAYKSIQATYKAYKHTSVQVYKYTRPSKRQMCSGLYLYSSSTNYRSSQKKKKKKSTLFSPQPSPIPKKKFPSFPPPPLSQLKRFSYPSMVLCILVAVTQHA